MAAGGNKAREKEQWRERERAWCHGKAVCAVCSLVCTHELDNRKVNFTGTRASLAHEARPCVLSFYFSGFWIGFNFHSWYSCPALIPLLPSSSPVTREYSFAEVFDCAREIARLAYVRAHLQTVRFPRDEQSLRCRTSALADNFSGASHPISLTRLYFSHFESQLRGLFEVSARQFRILNLKWETISSSLESRRAASRRSVSGRRRESQ